MGQDELQPDRRALAGLLREQAAEDEEREDNAPAGQGGRGGEAARGHPPPSKTRRPSRRSENAYESSDHQLGEVTGDGGQA